MNLTPLFSRIYRKVTRAERDIRELCVKRWSLCPSEIYRAPPAIYLDGDFDKITSLWEDTNHELEMMRLRGGVKEHGATVAYALTDVELLDGSLYKAGRRDRLLDRRERLIGPKVTESIPKASLACTLYGGIYFAHWMADDLTLHLAVEPLGTPFIASRRTYRQEPDYLKLLGMEQYRVSRAKLEHLVIVDDCGQNSFKRKRYNSLRSRLQSAVAASLNSRVFIRRGVAGASRALVNGVQVETYLQSQGFVVVDPDALSALEIVQQISGASIVVGVEGSHLIHGLMNLSDGGTLLVLQPPYRFNNLFKDYTDCLGMQYALLTGTAADGGFIVPLEELKRLLQKVETAV